MSLTDGVDKPGAYVAILQAIAKGLRTHAASDLARDWLDATGSLPWVQPRRLYQYPAKKDLFPRSAVMKLPSEHRGMLLSREFDERAYYDGRYGSGLSYWPLIEALARVGVSSLAGLRVLDIGYGTILPLRLMACLGARVTGIDTDTFPIAMYGEPADTGAVRATKAVTNPSRMTGSIELVRGKVGVEWTPPECDVVVSRNTLKNGYVHPKGDDEPSVRLGMEDGAFLRVMRGALARGGLMVVYNTFDSAEPGPGADGRCPFAREQFAAAGFEVTGLDEPDNASQERYAEVMRARVPLKAATPRALCTIVRAM
jgi:SAM-dependent methyltransferase